MKRAIALLTLASLLGTKICDAQEATGEVPVATQEATGDTTPVTGEASAEAAVIAANSDWENWIFAGCALAAVVAGVVIVSLNQGHTVHEH